MKTLSNEKIIRIKPAFEDARGAISNVLEEPINHVAIITSRKGAIRGNHYHPDQVQYEYLISGRYESVTLALGKKGADIEKTIIEPGSLVVTPPMIAHAMRFLEDSVMLNLTTGQRDKKDYEKHTKPHKLI